MRARLGRIGGEADARGVDVLLRVEEGTGLPSGAFVNALMQRPAVDDVIVLPPTALHGGDRIYAIRNGRLTGIRVSRIGERRTEAGVELLLRAPELRAGEQVMRTHLPNAIEGLAVEVVGAVAP
ncbi:hypothetical protein SDC9_206803 [bioreactor metagenome]|uniref:Uncharacterized protein n=1 Tax=bioreactor metagenome TaxID=1076179 RepID=A0A645J5T1_9ZZZZ